MCLWPRCKIDNRGPHHIIYNICIYILYPSRTEYVLQSLVFKEACSWRAWTGFFFFSSNSSGRSADSWHCRSQPNADVQMFISPLRRNRSTLSVVYVGFSCCWLFVYSAKDLAYLAILAHQPWSKCYKAGCFNKSSSSNDHVMDTMSKTCSLHL